MTAQAHAIAATPYVPLALEPEDVATYAAMAEALGCSAEDCGEAFMLATPLARDAAVLLWRGAAAMLPASTANAALRLQDALGTLRTLLGLDPAMLPLDALVASGLRYHA
ncbi:polysaccharide deacetylase [Roseomonas haemaphysalidis]|uniref:Polysaccharide deacetylase n=1 Tax=Roseomonas haemaphysalidis TaxID=2768162 RepID=A0ABS3KW37_9PROT|nr:polysaccharide deacetylase [Roseomonas haemaphysalidis]MBO1080526.1 polysaccharide deacetylase [Roseomonas haemaphysalidis]